MHVSLVRSDQMLKLINGIEHVEESRLERSRQFQSRDKDQCKKAPDKDQVERSKSRKKTNS